MMHTDFGGELIVNCPLSMEASSDINFQHTESVGTKTPWTDEAAIELFWPRSPTACLGKKIGSVQSF